MILLLTNIFRLPQSSTSALLIDSLFDFVLITCLISFVAVVFGKIFFLIRFHRRKVPEHKTAYITGHTVMEMSVAVLLTLWVMVLFYLGWVDYQKLRTAPVNALEINVIGKQWLWEFQYSDGRRLTNELVVPRGRPIKLIMTSQDVIHSFYVPNFRLKQDVLPKTYTSLWFEASEVGEHLVYCAEYCGTAHSKMLAKVKVLEAEDFEAWQVTPPQSSTSSKERGAVQTAAQNPLEVGKNLFSAKGCNACHSVDGSKGVGPTLKDLFGHTVELQDGKKIPVDENYIRESMMEPQAAVVKGFQPIMPTFKGQISDEEVSALIAYIKSLKEGGNP